jgi:hypothetical protein
VPSATVSCLLDWHPAIKAKTIAGYNSFFIRLFGLVQRK